MKVGLRYCVLLLLASPAHAEDLLRALIVTGQNGWHDWERMDEVVQTYLEETGRFDVTTAVSPGPGEDMSDFGPVFSEYDVVISNYDGDYWPEATRAAFANYVRNGGGFVSVHAADNAFPEWQAYVEMTGVGGWGYGDVQRDETWGPAVRFVDGKEERYFGPGRAFHPAPHDYIVTIRDTEHPITRGMPIEWLHADDELYSDLRGPARNMHVLATGISHHDFAGRTQNHEPVLFTVNFGEGRVFHTTLGHLGKGRDTLSGAVRCVGFIETLKRGTEWAATGKVTIPLPDEFPTSTSTLVRE